MPTDSTAERRPERPGAEPRGLRTSARGRGRARRPLARLVRYVRLAGSLGLALLLASTGCVYRKVVVVDDLLAPLASDVARVPSPTDLAAARLARAALVGSAASSDRPDAALAELEAVPKDDDEERLGALATDLRNATLDDPIAYRDASRALRRHRGIDPRLASRLDETIADDPLRIARRRKRDDWHRLFARTFNSVSEPLGQSVITGFFLAPYTLANSILHYFAEFSNAEPLSTTGRQALVLREEFLSTHPESPIAPEVARLVERDRIRFEKTLARRRIRVAENALDAGEPGLALHHARAATTVLAPHPDRNESARKRAAELERRAGALLAERERLVARSLEAKPTAAPLRESERDLATALLARPSTPARLEPALRRYSEAAGDAGDGRVAFIEAMARSEGGHEEPARRTLVALGGRSALDDPMTRHARQLVDDDWQNPWDAFRRLRSLGRRKALAYRLAGEWVNRPRYPNLWPPVSYLIDTPTIAMTIVLAPLRALISPFTGFPDFQRGASLAGYRYLLLHPAGDHQREVVRWLYDYERDERAWGRALRLADLMPDFPADERRELVEKTASEQIEHLDRLDRRDQRTSVLRGVATEYPDSKGGRDAGMKAREEVEKASPQNIRITRGFLLENPAVAGEAGLGLSPALLNGDPTDGELHPDGVVLRGGRVVEILLRAESRDEDAPPVSRVRRISKRRLVRLTAALDEAVRRNGLVDAGARFAADANRETYLEQARLGLTDDPDLRPAAESTFVYQSLRERYGAVRGRDSLLPFDLVFRGSLGDFSLGAFPRWRPPPETDDAFLYR